MLTSNLDKEQEIAEPKITTDEVNEGFRRGGLPSGENGKDSENSRVQPESEDCPSLHKCASEFRNETSSCSWSPQCLWQSLMDSIATLMQFLGTRISLFTEFEFRDLQYWINKTRPRGRSEHFGQLSTLFFFNHRFLPPALSVVEMTWSHKSKQLVFIIRARITTTKWKTVSHWANCT